MNKNEDEKPEAHLWSLLEKRDPKAGYGLSALLGMESFEKFQKKRREKVRNYKRGRRSKWQRR